MGGVIGFAMADEPLVGVNPEQEESRHDVVGDEGLDGGDVDAGAVWDGLGLWGDGGHEGFRNRVQGPCPVPAFAAKASGNWNR